MDPNNSVRVCNSAALHDPVRELWKLTNSVNKEVRDEICTELELLRGVYVTIWYVIFWCFEIKDQY